ncbi:hypothetical protein SRABI83_00102 [Arthrobacter sp. Bi83]|uniref:hypothetical protein n=1 Tax=Arthrobacter sp. Bi83 TaxID=2822353 RepID=UPI001D9FD717|nr:hypothetical protein [Arthrobacter sp. Bi83]CAH0126690.1 hypothetical protein SRABI83_00102 [Arthrobacter sp. Bi83]
MEQQQEDYQVLVQQLGGSVVAAYSDNDHSAYSGKPRPGYLALDVGTHTVKAGHFDLATLSGRAVAKTLAAWAVYEVETSADRVKATKLQAAKAGTSSGGNRAYGWNQNGMTLSETEAPIVREIEDGFKKIALDLNAGRSPRPRARCVQPSTAPNSNAAMASESTTASVRSSLDSPYSAVGSSFGKNAYSNIYSH